ncbi:MAG: hypothetical protein U9R02_12935, partial [Thermodesulfobacteriota bacterium]|nr:hypothetical protein [Thermodesulfobacteriota bacterium]
FFKLFDFNARDYYNVNNPVIKILLPKMNYKKDERIEVIRQAYTGLFQLVSRGLFDKYVDFIDVYAEVSKEEQENLYHEIIQHKETAMLAQYIRDKGMQQGMLQGMQQGMLQGMQQGMLLEAQDMLIEVLTERFGSVSGELSEQIKRINSRERLKDLLRHALRVKNFNEFGEKVVSN